MNNIKNLVEKVSDRLSQLKRYLPLMFVLLVLGIYGFLAYRVSTLNAAEPSITDVTTQSQTAKIPKVDPAVLNQIQSLQDNSSNVKALFNDSRDNPFQE